MKKRLLFLALWGLFSQVSLVNAQDKCAYMDELYVAEQMPDYKDAQKRMKDFANVFAAEIDAKRKDYDAKVKAFRELPESTAVSVREAKYKEIQELEKQIADLQQNSQTEYQQQLAKELNPIYDKIKKAVEEVSKDNGNMYIFRKEALMFQMEENNVSDMVIKKLGLTPPAPAVANRGNLKATNKIGFFDANAVIPQLPAYKQAASDIQVYSEMLKKEIEKIAAAVQKIAQEIEQGNLTDAQKKAKEAEGQKLMQQYQELQQSAQGKLRDKENKLMEPIYKALQEKINEVAKEGSYTFIFKMESSLQEPADANISDAVLKKFGVTPTPKTNGN
jgi:outer membrane protein